MSRKRKNLMSLMPKLTPYEREFLLKRLKIRGRKYHPKTIEELQLVPRDYALRQLGSALRYSKTLFTIRAKMYDVPAKYIRQIFGPPYQGEE